MSLLDLLVYVPELVERLLLALPPANVLAVARTCRAAHRHRERFLVYWLRHAPAALCWQCGRRRGTLVLTRPVRPLVCPGAHACPGGGGAPLWPGAPAVLVLHSRPERDCSGYQSAGSIHARGAAMLRFVGWRCAHCCPDWSTLPLSPLEVPRHDLATLCTPW